MSAPRKVLMMIDSLYAGGAERACVGLASALPPERYEVTLCATRRHKGSLAEEVVASGIRYETLGRRGRFDVLPFWRLFRLLRSGRYDVLHAHKHGSNLWGSIIGRLARTPVVVAHEHSWSYEGQRLRQFLDRNVIGRLADVLIAVSTSDRERMTSVEGIPPRKTTYIPNAFIPLSDPEGDLRAELGLAPDVPLVGTVAVLRPEKAIDVLLDAFAIVSERIPGVHLAIAGFGPLAEQWEAYANELGVGDRVHWLGLRKDAPVVVRALDVAAMSSEREGMPLFAFESMAEAKPLVATEVGGLRDIFENGKDALLVPPHDPAAMAEAIERLLTDTELRRAVATAAHARLDEFRVERGVERITSLYESLLERRGRGA